MLTIRTVLVEDSCILRQTAAELLDGAADIEIVGEAGNEREGIALAMKLQPEIVLIGLSAPQSIGKLLRRLTLFCPDTRAVVFSMFDGRVSGPAPPWSRHGVYMLTLTDLGSLVPAIRTVASLRDRDESIAYRAVGLRPELEGRWPAGARAAGR